MDWYLVSSQLYFTINLEEIFYFNNKKCRIYAVFGVSQTPNFDMSVKGDMRIVSNCIDMLIASYSSALQGNRTELDLPELIQLQVHSYE